MSWAGSNHEEGVLDIKEQIKRRREGSGEVPERAGTKAVKDDDAFILPVARIDAGTQARKTFEGLESLAESIQAEGQIEPVLVKTLPGGRYELIAGERRLRAIRDILKAKTIRASVRKNALSEFDKRKLQLAENKQRADYEPLELAKELAGMKNDFDLTDKALGEIIGKSESWVCKMRTLDDAPDQVKERIKSGRLTLRSYFNNKKEILAKKSRQVLIKVPYGKALELTQLMQEIAAQSEDLEPIALPKRPKKEDLLNILIERATEILTHYQEKQK